MGRSFLFSGGYTTYTTAAVDNGTVWGRVLRNCGPCSGTGRTRFMGEEGREGGIGSHFHQDFFPF